MVISNLQRLKTVEYQTYSELWRYGTTTILFSNFEFLLIFSVMAELDQETWRYSNRPTWRQFFVKSYGRLYSRTHGGSHQNRAHWKTYQTGTTFVVDLFFLLLHHYVLFIRKQLILFTKEYSREKNEFNKLSWFIEIKKNVKLSFPSTISYFKNIGSFDLNFKLVVIKDFSENLPFYNRRFF